MGTPDTAIAWLAREMADGQPHVAGGLLTRGAEAGYSPMALRRAARALGVKYTEACMGAKSNAPKVIIWRLAPGAQEAREERRRRDAERHAQAVAAATERITDGNHDL